MAPWEGEGCRVGDVIVREEDVAKGCSCCFRWGKNEEVSSSMKRVAKHMYGYQPLRANVQGQGNF